MAKSDLNLKSNVFDGITMAIEERQMDESISIYAEELTKIYKQADVEVVALKQISFSAKKGDFISIMGPSGSGKTTLLNLIGGLDRPSAGTLIVEGIPLTRLTWNELAEFRRKHIGFVFQQGNMNPILSVEENLYFSMLLRKPRPPSVIKKEITSLLELIGLTKRRKHRVHQLSAGERQRVSIGMAVIGEPPLVLLDEPTGNLDLDAATTVITLLKRINESFDTTIILVTHNPLVARAAEKTLYMLNGKLQDQPHQYLQNSYLADLVDTTNLAIPNASLTSSAKKMLKIPQIVYSCDCETKTSEKRISILLEVDVCPKCHKPRILVHQ